MPEAKTTEYLNGPFIKPFKTEVYKELQDMHDQQGNNMTTHERALAAMVKDDILAEITTSSSSSSSSSNNTTSSRIDHLLHHWDESDKRFHHARRAIGNDLGRQRWLKSQDRKDMIDRDYHDKINEEEEDGRKKKVIYLYDKWGYMPLKPLLAIWLSRQGCYTPSECQSQAIMPLLRHKNVAVQALSGMGKTLCFQLPLLQNIRTDINETQAVILVPTRELADQTEAKFREFERFVRNLREESGGGSSTATIEGGGEDLPAFSRLRVHKALPPLPLQGSTDTTTTITTTMQEETESTMSLPPHILITTPSHLHSLLKGGDDGVVAASKTPVINLSHEDFQYLIMDEVDDMMGSSVKEGGRKQVDIIKSFLPHLHPNRTVSGKGGGGGGGNEVVMII